MELYELRGVKSISVPRHLDLRRRNGTGDGFGIRKPAAERPLHRNINGTQGRNTGGEG